MQNEVNILLKEFSEKPIAYQPIYSKITKSITSGILLSQLLYWFYAVNEQEFYKTDNDFSKELAMGLYELKSAKKKLKELDLINITRKGVPAKTYYTVYIDEIIRLITSYGKNPQLDRGKTTNYIEEKPLTITENNTENNTESILKGSNEPGVISSNKITEPLLEEKRKNSRFPQDWYKQVSDAYVRLKGIELEGAEYSQIRQASKTMFHSKRTPEQIIDCMEFFKESAENDEQSIWSMWTILTVKRKLPEFLAGKLKG